MLRFTALVTQLAGYCPYVRTVYIQSFGTKSFGNLKPNALIELIPVYSPSIWFIIEKSLVN